MTRRYAAPFVLTISLVALAVRLYNLTYHSLWFDEAVSVRWARSDVATILDVSLKLVEDRLPPLYYLQLHAWVRLFGDGEAALRLLSVFQGLAAVVVIYAIGHMLFDYRVGTLAALLAAVNPFLVWYSQEVRMYALSALWAGLGVWCFLNALAADHRRFSPSLRALRPSTLWWAGFGLCAVGGLYTHLYTGFLWPALVGWLLSTRRWLRTAWLPFTLTMAAVSLLFLPLALAVWRFSGESPAGEPWQGVGGRLWWLLSAFTVWKSAMPAWLRGIVVGLVGGLAALGFLVGLASPRRLARSPLLPMRAAILLVGLLFLSPFMVATLLLLRNELAFFGARYFIVMIPWLLLAAAVGAVSLARIWGPLGPLASTAVVLASLLPLPGLWTPAVAKEAWRQATDYLASHVGPADVVLIHPDWTRFAFQYYYHGPGQTRAVFSAVDATTDLDGLLGGVVAAHPVIWLVQSHEAVPDPAHRVEGWLAARYPIVTELYPPGVVLKAFAPGFRLSGLPRQVRPVSIAFDGGLALQGFEVWDAALPAGDVLLHPPSNWIHVTLYWSALEQPDQAYTAYARLVDDEGQVWGDSDPLRRSTEAMRLFPSTSWQSGQIIRHDLDLNLNPVTPPGRYRLVVGLKDEQGRQTPAADGRPQVILEEIQILP